jgi:hypothetical protein
MASTEDETVEIYPAPEDMTDTATRLLEAAEKAGERVEVVETVSGGFRVPESIAKKAGVHGDSAPVPAKPAPAKKTSSRTAGE